MHMQCTCMSLDIDGRCADLQYLLCYQVCKRSHKAVRDLVQTVGFWIFASTLAKRSRIPEVIRYHPIHR